MDYKEFHEYCYEELCEKLNREPEVLELSDYVRDRMSDLVAAYED